MSNFIPNKYYLTYQKIITNANTRVFDKSIYTERHHIIPRCLAGSNSKDNIAVLTAREHFICHLLLVKFTSGVDCYRMKNAVAKFMQSTSPQQRKLSSRQYEKCRIYAAECASFFKTGKTRKLSSIEKAISTNYTRYGAGSSRINAVISNEQRNKMKILRAQRNSRDSWFVNADPVEVTLRQSEWNKKFSIFAINNPSLTDEGKRKLSLAKSPGTILTPYGEFECRYDFDLCKQCRLIGYENVFYLGLDLPIKTRAINRANLPLNWKGKTWRQVGFDILSNRA